jgi:Putative transposase
VHIGAVAFIHRFGSSLNEHVHFHVCVVDGVFEQLAGAADGDAQADTDDQSAPRKVIFHAAQAIDETAVDQVQATLRPRIPRAFAGGGCCGVSWPKRFWSTCIAASR